MGDEVCLARMKQSAKVYLADLQQGRYQGLLAVLLGARTLLGAPGIATSNLRQLGL